MVSPLLRSPEPLNDRLNPAADRLPSSQTPDLRQWLTAVVSRLGETGSDDLQRLESTVAWLKRESMIVRAETGCRTREGNRRLPRAVPLPPIPGLPVVGAESSGRKPEIFAVAPPLPCDRLQPPRRRHRRNLRGALWLSIAGVIVGSIAYHVSAGELLSAWEPAQAASLQP
jgi:hypothetical protein